MGFLSSVHEDTPTHPKDDPDVQAKGRVEQAARVTLTELETRERDLQRDCGSVDELCRLTAMHELAGLRQRYLAAKGAWVLAKRDYDKAVEEASVPWQKYWHQHYREAAERFLTWLETDALRENDEMLAAQAAAMAAGVGVEPLHIPHLLPEAIAHRARVARQGLGPS